MSCLRNRCLVGLQVEARCFPEQLFRKSGPTPPAAHATGLNAVLGATCVGYAPLPTRPPGFPWLLSAQPALTQTCVACLSSCQIPAREECVRRPSRAAINISSELRPHLCLVLNGGIFMKGKYLQGKSVSQRLRGERGG